MAVPADEDICGYLLAEWCKFDFVGHFQSMTRRDVKSLSFDAAVYGMYVWSELVFR